MARERRRLVLILALAALLAAPTGTAVWSAYGTREPDTSYDLASQRMWTGPDDSPTTSPGRVYFDVFQTEAFSTLSPNAATLGTRVFAEPASQFHALLGLWKDCNGDAYVGEATSGLLEYRSELLLSQGPCAPSNAPYAFNDGQWVTELIAIGAADPCSFREQSFRSAHCGGIAAFQPNPVVINSMDTIVWLDLGTPGAGAPPACQIAPPPRAATASAGGILAYVTCFDDEREIVLFDQVDRSLDPSNNLGLYFDDPHRPQDSDSILAPHFPVNAFGDSKNGQAGLLERGSGEPAFTVFDCQPGTSYTPISGLAVDPTNNRTLDPNVARPAGSWWDATELAFEDMAGDCDPGTGNVLGAIAYETLVARARGPDAPPGEVRAHVDDALVFTAGTRGVHADLSTGLPTDDTARTVTDIGNQTADGLYGARGARDAGLPYARGQAGGPLWSSRLVWQRAQTTQPVFVTAYARLNRSDINSHGWLLPTQAPAVFGAESCGASAGISGASDQNGWACDPARWYLADDGEDTMPYTAGGADYGKPLAARPGDLYDLVDVDCFDGHVASAMGADVQASADQVTGALPCAPLT